MSSRGMKVALLSFRGPRPAVVTSVSSWSGRESPLTYGSGAGGEMTYENFRNAIATGFCNEVCACARALAPHTISLSMCGRP